MVPYLPDRVWDVISAEACLRTDFSGLIVLPARQPEGQYASRTNPRREYLHHLAWAAKRQTSEPSHLELLGNLLDDLLCHLSHHLVGEVTMLDQLLISSPMLYAREVTGASILGSLTWRRQTKTPCPRVLVEAAVIINALRAVDSAHSTNGAADSRTETC